MDKGFSISGYLLSRLQPDDPQEARLRMLCVTISKDMPEERRERQLRPFASDMEFMNMIAGWMNGLPEAISHEQPDFERWLELFMTAGEAESTRYVMRLQIWYTHYCCVEELLTLCRLLQRHREEHLEAIYHRMLYYFREARIQCGMPSTSEPAEGIEVSFKLLDASYEHINRKIILQAEELLGIHTDHSFIQKVMECHTEAKTAEELAELLDADMLVILTSVDNVCLNYGQPDEKPLSTMTVAEAKKYMEQGQFGEGDMLPKIEAAINFIGDSAIRSVLITKLNKDGSNIHGGMGTMITK